MDSGIGFGTSKNVRIGILGQSQRSFNARSKPVKVLVNSGQRRSTGRVNGSGRVNGVDAVIHGADMTVYVLTWKSKIDVAEWKGDLLALGVTEKDMIKDENSKENRPVLVYRLRGLGSKRVGLFGLGRSASSPAAFRGLGEAVSAVAKTAQASSVAIVLASSESLSTESKCSAASAITSGTCEDNKYKSESKKSQLNSVDIIGLGTGPGIEKKLNDTALAAEASKTASTYSDVLSANILTEEQCRELKMGSYLELLQHLQNPPHFIHLCYKPPSGPIKTNSAAVFGAANALGRIKPPGVEVHFIVASCENMISGTGMRPGDIVTASNGKTIEVNNTDAEGRLTLADALVYACNQGVEKIVDLATLTGACVVALGPSIAGIFTPSDDLSKEVLEASEVSGERFWRISIRGKLLGVDEIRRCDLVNTGGRQGGAINAALFLKQFVDEKVQWLHIDMAGPVLNDKKHVATGFGISTLVEWVLKNSLKWEARRRRTCLRWLVSLRSVS
ncbi:Leucine aminopeptidase 2 [Hibiscus syriacus]|uniref:Leucine aminopeptidase 2 n=1 Tax=Hibiscus syriacus TaxID=106335 RepID=A0A6A2YJ69_HIBSY|nr:Leucine aminopeptidase 2 [Hibiscus syriacus]